MTIKIYRRHEPYKLLHNVEAVRDNGIEAITVVMQFGEPQTFSNVTQVVVTPEKP